MEIKVKFNTKDAKLEIIKFKQYIENIKPKGFKVELEKLKHKEGELGVEWLEVLKIAISATATAAMLKGFFDLLIAFFVDKQKQKMTIERDKEKQELEIRERVIKELISKGITTIIILDEKGKESKITLSKFDKNEFNQITSLIFSQKK